MEALDIARWQFGITTVYHFFFVPVTIGLVFLVAMLQTAWHRTGNEKYLRLTRFYGKLFLINFALGIATGIVQEFQFGMSGHSSQKAHNTESFDKNQLLESCYNMDIDYGRKMYLF